MELKEIKIIKENKALLIIGIIIIGFILVVSGLGSSIISIATDTPKLCSDTPYDKDCICSEGYEKLKVDSFKYDCRLVEELNNSLLEIESGYILTTHQDVNEKLYKGTKTELFDSYGLSLGFYKTDFLEQLKIEGSGKGDGVQNDESKYIHYDFGIDDGKTCYLSDISLGAYDNEIYPWNSSRPCVAVNPNLPRGTKIKFIDLGEEAIDNPSWINELLKTKTFYADDKMYGEHEKKIDVYIGLQKSKEYGPESLWMHNVTIGIKYID